MGSLGRAIYTVGVWFRESGQAIDRLGCLLQGKYYFQEQGHGAVLHGCTVENEAFIGMGATLLDGVLRNMHWLLLEPLYCRELGSPVERLGDLQVLGKYKTWNHLPRKFLLKKLGKVLRKKFAYPETDYAALVSVDRETPPELILPYNILLEKLRKAT